MEVREGENALDVYEHALAYLPTRAFPGRPRTAGGRTCSRPPRYTRLPR